MPRICVWLFCIWISRSWEEFRTWWLRQFLCGLFWIWRLESFRFNYQSPRLNYSTVWNLLSMLSFLDLLWWHVFVGFSPTVIISHGRYWSFPILWESHPLNSFRKYWRSEEDSGVILRFYQSLHAWGVIRHSHSQATRPLGKGRDPIHEPWNSYTHIST